MEADQRKKRLNGTITGCSSWEQHGTRKKRLESGKKDLNKKSHISLEWDGSQEKVVAKKEQIGISWRDVRLFVDSVPQSHDIVADIVTIPQEIFDLENLMEVLSYQVWQTHLSENERSFLQQFLPREQDAPQVAQALLGGDNFHFGNPFLKWGASLCSGNLHPDAVLHQEKCLKSDKKAYYLELQRYHHDMIEYLQKLKGKWESCKDPEKEIQQKTWRSRRDDGGIFFAANGSRLSILEDNIAATSNSSSSMEEEKASSSDNQNYSIFKDGELQKRRHKKGLKKDKRIYPLNASDHAVNVGNVPRKGGKIHKRNIQHSDGAEYMSYLKISKKQYKLVKNMKQSGKSIQSKTLNHVLGNHNSWHVQPFVVFEEEEQRKWQDHWLQLANKDVPAAYVNWRQRRFQIGEIIKSLEQDMKNELKLQMEDEKKGNHENVIQDHNDSSTAGEPKNKDDSVSGSLQNQSPEQISCLKGGHHLNASTMDAENNHITSRSGDASPDASRYLENVNIANVLVSQDVTISSHGDDFWSHSYYKSTGINEYTSAGGFSHPEQVNEGQRTRVIDEEPGTGDETNRKHLLLRQSDDGSFSSYPNHDRNEFLQSLFKGHGMLSYHLEQKQAGFDFPPPNNVLVEDSQFHGHFPDQVQPLLPLEQEQQTENEGYMQRRMSLDIYSGGGGYLIPRQEHAPPLGVQDWAINSSPMLTTTLQSDVNGGELLNQDWFPAEHQMRGSWSGSDGVNVPSQNIASGSNANQSLFSVLSQCNQLRYSSSYDSVDSTEQIILPRNHGIVGGVAPRMTNALSQGAHPINYLGGRDAATTDGMGWMNLQQNSALHESTGKRYLGSWNR